jgi:hypothetical protein
MKKSGSILLVSLIVIFSGCQQSQQKQAPDISGSNKLVADKNLKNKPARHQNVKEKTTQQADAAKLLADKTSADLRKEVERLTKENEQLRAEIERLKAQPPPAPPPPQTLRTNDGYKLVAQAFMQQPSQAAAVELIYAANRNPQLRDQITDVFNQYFNDFIEKKQTYVKQNGYRERLVSAVLAGNYLANINRNNPKLVDKYKEYLKEFSEEQQRSSETSRW